MTHSKKDITEEYASLTAQLKKAKNSVLSERELGELKTMYSHLESVGSYEKQIPEYKQVMHEFASIFEAHESKIPARTQKYLIDFHTQLGGYLGGRVSLDQVLKDTPEISRLYVQVRDSKAYQENPSIAQRIDRRVGYIIDKFTREAEYRLNTFKEAIFTRTPVPSHDFQALPPMKSYSVFELEELEARKWADDLEKRAVPKPPREEEPYMPRRSVHDQPTLKEDLGRDFHRMERFLEQCVFLGTLFGEPRVRDTAIKALKVVNPYLQGKSPHIIERSCYGEVGEWPNPQEMGKQASEWEQKIRVNNHHLNGARPIYETIRSVKTLANHNPLSLNSLGMYVRKTRGALREKFAVWYHDISKYF